MNLMTAKTTRVDRVCDAVTCLYHGLDDRKDSRRDRFARWDKNRRAFGKEVNRLNEDDSYGGTPLQRLS